MRALRRRRPSVIRPWPARLRSVRAWRRARHAGTPALARDAGLRHRRAGLADGDRPPARESGRQPLHVPVRPLNAPEQAEPHRPLSLRLRRCLGHADARRRPLRRRGRRLRRLRQHDGGAVPDPGREPHRPLLTLSPARLVRVSDLLATRDRTVWARSDARLQHERR